MKYLFLTLVLFPSISVSFADSRNINTPENTLIAYDKAWIEMDIEGIRRCLTENAKKDFNKEHLDGLSSSEIEEFRQVMLRILQYSKYTKNIVIEKKQISDTELHLKVRKEFYDSTFTKKYEEKMTIFIFKVEDKEWKIDSQTVKGQKK